jgi:hypothetical protein
LVLLCCVRETMLLSFVMQWTSHGGIRKLAMLSAETFCKLKPFPRFRQRTGHGFGLAACPSLNLLVTSEYNDTLSVWGIPSGGDGGGLTLLCTLGNRTSETAMQFKFSAMDTGYRMDTGYLAFTPPAMDDNNIARPLLLVTDAGADAVHVVDVVGRTHEGYVACPGSITRPRGVAASTTSSALVAVSAWKKDNSGDHVVILYRGSGAVWEVVWVIETPGTGNGTLDMPYGLRFTSDGSGICVAVYEYGNGRASLLRVDDGGLVRHIATTGLRGLRDVLEVDGGWLVVCSTSSTVEFVSDGDGGDGRPYLGRAGRGMGVDDGEFSFPSTLAVVPGLGLVVREWFNERLQVFATSDTMAMLTNMSAIRIAWMCTVARAILNRRASVA